ncbi:MAG TPA: FtsK/SpoIIIE domain-containing protein, partial [Actinomycetes bacterium]
MLDGYRGGGSGIDAVAGLDQTLAEAGRLGMTFVVRCDSADDLPGTCDARVDRDVDGTWTARLSGERPQPITGIVSDAVPAEAVAELARWLAPRRAAGDEGQRRRHGPLRLGDLLDEGHRSPAVATGALRPVPIGLDATGATLLLDINEAAAGGQGPHGVLVGATGSGKSELLRSFVAGLAARHSPQELAVLLVDFKGGAAFAELAGLPHTAGVVTNLADDLTLVDRVRVALVAELARRQELLRCNGFASIRDLYDARGRTSATTGSEASPAVEEAEPLAHLVVVVDEFGELLSARPEFLDTFVQVGRLGRSLGVHLLLATQHLDEGRLGGLESHLRYRLALQTFTAGESVAVLGTAAAYELPAVPGQGYLKVDGVLTRFQAARATCPAPADEATDRVPVAEPFNLLRATDAPSTPTAPPSGRTDLDALVERARGDHPTRARAVWTPPLPRELSVVDLARPRAGLAAAVGLVDEPARQRQRPLVVDLSEQGHVAVVGGARSGRSSFLHTLVRSLATVHDPSALHVYAVDQGSALRTLVELPHVGAVAGRHDPASVLRVLDELHVIAAERAAALLSADATGPSPGCAQVLLVVDGLGQLRADHPDEELRLVELATAGPALGIHLAITAGRWLDFRPALLDALPLRLELRLADPSDSGLGRALAADVPARPGRGLTAAGHHLQLATAGDRLAVR